MSKSNTRQTTGCFIVFWRGYWKILCLASRIGNTQVMHSIVFLDAEFADSRSSRTHIHLRAVFLESPRSSIRCCRFRRATTRISAPSQCASSSRCFAFPLAPSARLLAHPSRQGRRAADPSPPRNQACAVEPLWPDFPGCCAQRVTSCPNSYHPSRALSCRLCLRPRTRPCG